MTIVGICLLERALLAVLLFASISTAFSQALSSAPAKPLPPGPMQAKVKAACTQCHNAGRITEQHFSRLKWSDELDKMEGLGAVVAESDRNDFLDYLTANFGPEKGAAQTTPNKSSDKK